MEFIYGLNKTGISLIKLLKKYKKNYRLWDDNKEIRNKLKKIYKENIFIKPLKKNLNNFKNIYVSPGITIRQEKFQIKNKRNKLKRDLNLYFSNITNEKIVSITGTNGKSTSTKLIGDLLKKKKFDTFVGGNIGEPLCNSLIKKKKYKYHVIELSSFQLETINNFNSHISVITNISNDHTDRYINISDYVNQKKKIISNSGYNLISIDDKYSKKIFYKKDNLTKISFSTLNPDANIFINEKLIKDNYFYKNKNIYLKNISKNLNGSFNLQNIIILYICSKILKISEKYFFQVISTFRGLPFRSQIICDNKKYLIVNNSKSTNLNSTITLLDNYEKVYLILGGIAKEKNFDIINKYKSKIICSYIYGKSASLIQNKIKNKIKTKKFKFLKNVIKELSNDLKFVKIKSIILFTPACSSYDQFKNFEERGNLFNNYIKKELKIK